MCCFFLQFLLLKILICSSYQLSWSDILLPAGCLVIHITNTIHMKEKKKHPIHYTVFHPNILIGVNTELKLAEQRLYMEVLNFNHLAEPDRLDYEIPYEFITHSTDKKVIQKKAHQEFTRIAEVLQKRVFRLDKEFMQTYFNEKYAVTFNPFPVIKYKEKHFQVRLNEYLKAILVKLEIGFTKGDIELLRTFRSEYSFLMYWLIRKQQWKQRGGMLEFTVEGLKKALGCEDQYKGRFNNFKARVLDVVYQEFKGTWVEFEYEIIRGGKGGKAIQAIRFYFKNDAQQERTLTTVAQYEWEAELLRYGVQERDVWRIRDWVNTSAPLKDDYIWDSFYVETCIKIAQEHYRSKRQQQKIKQIQNMANYIYAALTNGWWLPEIEFRRSELQKKSLSILMQSATKRSVSSTAADAPEDTTIAMLMKPTSYTAECQTQIPFAAAKPKFTMPYADFQATYRAYCEATGETVSEADFATRLGYVIAGDVVEKR